MAMKLLQIAKGSNHASALYLSFCVAIRSAMLWRNTQYTLGLLSAEGAAESKKEYHGKGGTRR